MPQAPKDKMVDNIFITQAGGQNPLLRVKDESNRLNLEIRILVARMQYFHLSVHPSVKHPLNFCASRGLATLLENECLTLSGYKSVGQLVRWSVGPLDRWSVGPLVRWSVDPLVGL